LRQPPETLLGSADGTLLVEGDLRHLEGIVVHGDLPRFDAALRSINLRADRPVRFRYQRNQVQLEQFHLAGPNLDLEATGGIRLGTDPALNLTARGRADLAALPALDPRLAVTGRASLDANLNGTLARPLWRGRLLVADGSVRYADLPNSLTAIQGTIVFDGNRGFLEEVTGESGGGLLRLGGFLSYEGDSGWRVQLTADAEEVRVRYPAGVSTVLDGRLTLSGSPSDSLLGGQVVIRRQSISPAFDLAQALLSSRGPGGGPLSEGFLRNMRLDLEVTSAPDIRFETATARNLQGSAELRIRGTFDRPALLGRIGIQGGELFFAGKRYTVSRGEIAFVNPFRIEPILNLSVQARVQQYDISMDFIGPPDRLTLTYHSDPPLPTRDILALLVAGNSGPTTSETVSTQPVPELGATSLLSQALTAQIGSRLDRLFGAGRVRVDPQLAGVGRSLDASVAFEQQIRENITVTYITNVATVREQIIRGEWAISPRYSLAAIRDQNGLVGVNLQMTLRFR
jgi:translocation and assembly module TamB